MKIKTIILSAILIMSNSIFAQQKYDIHQITSEYPVSVIQDISFVDFNTGYLTAVKWVYNPNYSSDINYVFKTTNGGVNWGKVWENSYVTNSKKITVSFINASTGYISKGTMLKKTTNEGLNWSDISTSGLFNFNNLICSKINGDIYLIQFNSKIYKYSNSNGFQEIKDFGSGYSINYFEISKINENNMYVCGEHRYENPLRFRPFFAKSTNSGTDWEIIIDGDSDPNNTGHYEHMSVTNEGSNDVVKIAAQNKLLEYRNGEINILASEWASGITISFGDYYNGYYLKYDGGNDDPPDDLGNAGAYRTTDGGQTWSIDLDISQGGHFLNTVYRFFSKGQITYFTESMPNSYAKFYVRKLDLNIFTKYDNIDNSGSFKINNILYNTPQSLLLRGGEVSAWSEAMLNSGQVNERIFYRWLNGNMNNSVTNYELIYGYLGTYYKTKLQSTTENAINIPSQTKAIRDNFGRINSIHTSMGGVFFTKSYNNGSNFTTEEIINDKYSGINSCATENNINPFINEALAIDGYPEHISSERNVVAVWERREGNNVIIDYGQRHSIQFGYPYYWDPRGNPSPYRITINSENQNFKAYPKVFAKVMYENFLPDTTYDFLTLIAHLKPGGNNNQLVVTGKKSQGANPQEFIIDGDNIESFSAVRSSIGNNLVVHFSYKKNSHIFYKKVYFGIYNNSIYVDSNYYGQGCTIISEGDEQNSRFTPDISLRNGRPVIAYRGDCRKLRIISFEGNEPVTETIYNYPIIVRYKYFNGSNEVWSIFVKYNSAGNVFQDEPNVEGSKDALAYVVNFRVANSYFKKFVLIKDYPGYSCSPGTFYGKDAKLVRGSYQGNFGTNSYPTLLTLTQNGSLYDVWKQTFTILPNTPVFEYPNTNLVGVIRDLDINYYFNLGPIIAKNIICSLEDDLETVVENPVEFNENMISQPFSLSNGDTLLVGGLGSYSYYPGCDFRIKKFDVNLLIKSTNQLQRNLFSDTIQYEDSIETEYLRGFIIDNIQNGTDSFYIQLVVAPEDITDGSFLYSNVYSPDEEGGDNPGGTKSRYVLFEKGKSGYNQNIPTEYSLSQNYPNPFNPVTKIQFDIPKNGLVSLKVYDVLGREVKNIVNEVKSAGRYTVLLDGSDLSSGVYFYRIESGDFVQVKRMVLLK